MKTSWLIIKRTLIIVLVQVALFAGTVSIAPQQALAETITPEASSYQVDKTAQEVKLGAESAKNNAKNAAENTGEAVKKATENVKEKLNLDEPIPSDTKKFFRQITGQEPIENERIPELNN